MKKRPTSEENQSARAKAIIPEQTPDLFPDCFPIGHFAGTDNPRYLRAINALIRGPIWRERLDRIAGCSNGPDLVDGLRSLGLEVPCKRIARIDRDKRYTRPGLYSLTENDRKLLAEWRKRQQKVA